MYDYLKLRRKIRRFLWVIFFLVIILFAIYRNLFGSKKEEESPGQEVQITADLYKVTKLNDDIILNVIGTYNGDDLVLKFKPKDFNMVEKFSSCKDYVYYEVIFNDKSNEVLKVKAFSKDDKIDVTNYDETLLETVCKK